MQIYNMLLSCYGKQGWWPVEYAKNEHEACFEIALGAILTQNTAWRNVEKALENLARAQKLSMHAIATSSERELARLIRPAGYYNQKAKRVKGLARFFLTLCKEKDKKLHVPSRSSLLALHGIGKETADSILLYAFAQPYFVIDAYTRRLFSRLFSLQLKSYDKWQDFFMENLPCDIELYKEYHALIVEHCKNTCRKEPKCDECVLQQECNFAREAQSKGRISP